ncbi:4-(cytidine 5'-diphospho)-2-C-methyl-D-erythritol kinase [Marvinbryantia formatexigens DSM 14469]|uniref:4-diphosphocytidyl-2-C-methyl-D-erythritol kinase n=1 Tax=Marvinbryantia formatexigens DSM 14469 TaxID=478749 RepID=C6LJR1_9FIRM|nr:4-(cytidine 5'-diphospho)-2-C-methyl-D-erythritol kinase [Marvinbryantia formatexigens]EET59184.1 4-(cytidine 5'-diphospho)-2-C-methyl-D-erythritol kinase [Marvinbryantia formatexigens DSM 14469]UWO26209.1 4-(cytidine 5'-diphospho)-2-C-methyl-D-erythritol kinase [Marvinbryantia formatexigens DSM 14469]SDG12557.1 4-diphosphocytidyl-2-C-methyl-D-erythritol kinase [Marvinbryantia formatexigens]
MKEIKLKAKAKINLGLDVLRKREDGYHEVRMIMQTIGLYDRLVIRPAADGQISIRTNLRFLPTGEDNLVYRAAKLLMDEFQIKQGVEIELGKYIPVAAGMAGGSSDAAATLVGVNKLFELGLDTEQLMKRGVKIGADVPFCVMRGTALAEGIGERLTPLPPMPECHILIAKPGIHVSTKFVYGNLRADELKEHPDIDGQIEALKRGDLHGLARLMGNVLETVTIPEYPVIRRIKEVMKEHGALNAMMSGSGPTVFGLFEDAAAAQEAYRALDGGGEAKQVYLVS